VCVPYVSRLDHVTEMKMRLIKDALTVWRPSGAKRYSKRPGPAADRVWL